MAKHLACKELIGCKGSSYQNNTSTSHMFSLCIGMEVSYSEPDIFKSGTVMFDPFLPDRAKRSYKSPYSRL